MVQVAGSGGFPTARKPTRAIPGVDQPGQPRGGKSAADVHDLAVYRVGQDPPPGRLLGQCAGGGGGDRPVPGELPGGVGHPGQGRDRDEYPDLHRHVGTAVTAEQHIDKHIRAAGVHPPGILRRCGAAGEGVEALVGGLGVGGGQQRPQFGHPVLDRSHPHVPVPAGLHLPAAGAVGVSGEHGAAQRLPEQAVAGPPAAGEDPRLHGGGLLVGERGGSLDRRPQTAQVDITGVQGGQGGG